MDTAVKTREENYAKMADKKVTVWGFGYGSNMNLEHLIEKKGVQILEHTPAILNGFQLAFIVRGMDLVEPGFAGLTLQDGAEVHGLAYRVSKSDMDKIDEKEGGSYYYDKVQVLAIAYDGRQLAVDIHMNRNLPMITRSPSRRYLNLLIDGGKKVGLDDSYIKWLESIDAYKVPEHILEARKRYIPNTLKDLPEIGLKELNKHNAVDDCWVSVMGFVIKYPKDRKLLQAHRGIEIAGKSILHLHNISFDENPDITRGRPPYPLLNNISSDELEFIKMFLDEKMFKVDERYNIIGISEIVGYLKEWKEQQDQGTTDFILPKKRI